MIDEKSKNIGKTVITVGSLEPPSVINLTKPITYEHPKGYTLGNVKGMNTIPYVFSVMTRGNPTDDKLFSIDSGSVLDGHNGILSITALKLILFNIPQKDIDTIPEIFYLTCD